MKPGKIPIVILAVIGLSLPLSGFAKTIIHKSKKISQLATGCIDYSDNGYVLFIPENVNFSSRVTLLVALPALGAKARQDIANWSSVAEKKGFAVISIDVDYSSIITSDDIDALYARITNIVDSLAVLYPLDKELLFLSGTSAGGMMAISLGLRYPGKFAGIGVVSGGFLRFESDGLLPSAKGQRFYMVHGADDDLVPVKMFYSTRDILEKNGAIVRSKVYLKGRHPVDSEGYKQIVNWFTRSRPDEHKLE